MYYEVYVDVLFMVNFCVDILLLFMTAKILKIKSYKIGIIFAGVIGGLWTCIISIYPLSNRLLEGLITYLLISVLMVIIAFHIKNPYLILKSVGILYLTTFLLGGILNFISSSTSVGYYLRLMLSKESIKNMNIQKFVIFSIITFIIIEIIIKLVRHLQFTHKNIYAVELIINGHSIKTTGLLDTGNSLREPITGKAVIIAEYSLIENVISGSMKILIQDYVENHTINYENLSDEDASRIKLIPYHAIGTKNGLLIGMIAEKIIINPGNNMQVKDRVMVAIYEKKLSAKEEYHIILHPDLM